MADGNVAAGESLIVNANQLTVGENVTFDGSAELDGTYQIFSGNGSDTILGSQNGDTISGGGGADTLTGNGGDDTFLYTNLTDSLPGSEDTILDFTVGDTIALNGIDADASMAGNQVFDFVGAAGFSNTAGELRAVNTSGDDWTVEADVDGAADFAINVITSDGDPLTETDFLL